MKQPDKQLSKTPALDEFIKNCQERLKAVSKQNDLDKAIKSLMIWQVQELAEAIRKDLQ